MTTCVLCGEVFQPKRNDARYCSDRCRQRGHRNMRTGTQMSSCDENAPVTDKLSHREIIKPEPAKVHTHELIAKPEPEPADCYTYDENAPETFAQLMARLTPGNDSAPRDQ